uniref:Uncharacterized protein n=1 Tax=Lepeophtheirus salmonis TaxID=72036 RepID=A0A0K2UT02_LEPSM
MLFLNYLFKILLIGPYFIMVFSIIACLHVLTSYFSSILCYIIIKL